MAHGGHLVLSVIAGAAYGALKPERASPIVAGTIFGVGLYALVGPAGGVTPPP